MKVLLKKYYQSLYRDSLDPQKKIAWCSSVGPVEILIAMGFSVYFPENYGALIGAKKLSTKFITAANSLGYSPEICSYLTSDIGSYLLKEGPLEKAYGIPGPPKPAVLVYNTNQCREIQDWFSFYSEEYQVPSLGIHSPWRLKEITREDVAYSKAQLKNLVADLEEITQQKFDFDCFKEVIKLSAEGSKQWSQFLSSAKNQPSPITFFDACIHMAPIVLMRGQKESVEYYQMLNEEVSQRVTHGTGAVKNELCRFYWEGMPIWGRLRFLSELFAQESGAVVASTYCNSWNFSELDPAQPFESMARSYLEIFINRDERIKEKMLAAAATEYSIDAVIFHDAKTCPHNTNSRFGMPERIKEKYGISTVVIFGDLNDTRCFSDEQTVTLVQAFMENFKQGNRA